MLVKFTVVYCSGGQVSFWADSTDMLVNIYRNISVVATVLFVQTENRKYSTTRQPSLREVEKFGARIFWN